MCNAISVHIGLNEIDSSIYGNDGRLKGCENDALFMMKLAKANGFCANLLLSSKWTVESASGTTVNDASYQNVMKVLRNARDELSDSGTMLITFSGHGTFRGDGSGNRWDFEPDFRDECWILFDGLLFDDEIYHFFAGFKERQKVIMISDSCHSGTVGDPPQSAFLEKLLLPKRVVKDFEELDVFGIDVDNFRLGLSNKLSYSSAPFDGIRFESDEILLKAILGLDFNEIADANRFRFISNDDLEKNGFFDRYGAVLDARELELRDYYEKNVPKDMRFQELVQARVITFSACQDWQLARDGNQYGVFTEALKDVLVEAKQITIDAEGKVTLLQGADNMNYLELHQEIWLKLKDKPHRQTPTYERLGHPNATFELGRCFSI